MLSTGLKSAMRYKNHQEDVKKLEVSNGLRDFSKRLVVWIVSTEENIQDME